MIIEDSINSYIRLQAPPSPPGTTYLTWAYNPLEQERRIAAFLIVYRRGDRHLQSCLDMLRSQDDNEFRRLAETGGWLGGIVPSGVESQLIHVKPAGVADFSISDQIFRPPCRIEIWTVVEAEDVLHLYYASSMSVYRSLHLRQSIQAKIFKPAQYSRIFHKEKRPAISGVEILIDTEKADDRGNFDDGAVYYTVKSDPKGYMYPLSRESLGLPLMFCSDNRYHYRVEDFEVKVSPEFTNLYTL